jgi:photosystem II stability/assembly factor-like uncharacterized protein
MDEPRDDIDSWLGERVTPLLPHPGAFDRIRRKARRRKAGQAAIAAGGAAVVVVAAATVPHLVIAQLRPTVQQGRFSSSSPTPRLSNSPATVIPSHPKPSPSPSSSTTPPPPVPGNFQPSSVTFVSAATGWVIGQAGTPGTCANATPYICTSVAITDDGGQTWHGSHAPSAGLPSGPHGVTGVRSLDGTSSWAFGPELWSTHDGGQTWARIPTHGLRVTDLETVNGRVFAIWAHCPAPGADFAASCTSFSLYSSPTGADQWAPVPGMSGLSTGRPAAASSAQLVLTGSAGYLLGPDGTVYHGSLSGTAAWQAGAPAGAPPNCSPGPAQANGVPSTAMLASTGTAGLVELCTGAASGATQTKNLLYSADGGQTWSPAGSAPRAGIATSLSGTPGGPVLVATNQGIDVSAHAPEVIPGRMRWLAVQGTAVPGGFSYVGMTTDGQGVAVPADQGLHEILFTYDGGTQWRPSALP